MDFGAGIGGGRATAGRLVAWQLAAGCGIAALLAVTTLPALSAAPTDPNTSIYQKNVTSRLNSTGRTINMPVPLKDEGQTLGEIVVRIEPDDRVFLPKAALVDKMTRILDAATMARLHQVRDTNGQISVADLKEAGFNFRFDPNALELVFALNADQRPTGDLSLRRYNAPRASANTVRPAIFSGYLNTFVGVDHRWGNGARDAETSGTASFESVFRLYNVVLENAFVYDGLVNTFTCPVSAICSTDHREGFKRQRTRLVYDAPDSMLRIQVGDADTYGTGFQRAPDVLGVTIEKSPRKLRPGESIRPTGRSSFRIERPSSVEVLVNGAIVQRFQLRAGNYNLSDLPLAGGANDVQLIITDDTGQRRTLAFTTYFDGSLLGQGKSEWSATAGVPSYFKDNERVYRDGEYFGSGFFRYGLTDRVTAEAHVQGDQNVTMGGGGLFTALPWGFVGLQGGVSTSSSGTGFAVNANWDILNFKGPLQYFAYGRESLRFGAEYRSSAFRTPGEFLTTATGVLFPQYNYTWRFLASYSVPLTDKLSATLSGRYQMADDKALILSPYTLQGDRYGVDLTLSQVLSPELSGSLTVGYSNESYLFSDTRTDNRADFRVMGRLYWRPAENVRVAVGHDTLNRESYASAYMGAGRGLDRWDASADVLTNGRSNTTSGTVGASYYGNRAEARVSHTGGMDGFYGGGSGATNQDQVTSARVGSSIAFADGAVAIGQPIRGNGFAIVTRHESIADKTVTVGAGDDIRARADVLGPAVVTDIPAYTASSTPVDVAGLPLGYSLGAGAFDTFAPYRGGYKFEVGSAYSVQAFGTLLRANGEPISLLTGVAYPVDNPEKQVAVFTNSSGKFGADGLAPGRWIIDMATEGAPTRFVIEVPKGTDGLFRAGTLKPAGRG